MENQGFQGDDPPKNENFIEQTREHKRQKRGSLLEAAKNAADNPGVYLMKDQALLVIYVGKAKNLRNRIISYFQPAQHERLRTEHMVQNVEVFDVILTETEAEALILEATLIKKHKPRFNVRLKDDRAYPYLKITLADPFARLEWTRKVIKDQARYFGPFPSSWAARQVMDLLNETFKLRDCTDNTFRHRSRPCMLYQIGRCTAPCVQLVSCEDYRVQIEGAITVLQGKGTAFVDSLSVQMNEASLEQEFERAATLRDQIRNIEIVTQTQVVDEAGSNRNRDIFGIARAKRSSEDTQENEADGHGVVLLVRAGRLIAVRHYHLQNLDLSLSNEEVLKDFLIQYYFNFLEKEESAIAANEILLPYAPFETILLEKTLSMKIMVPETEVEARLINVALANAEHALNQNKKKGHSLQALEDVKRRLHLDRLPARIECYDISNIQNESPVASRVVFIEGAPDKNLYRRYKIKTVEGQNDFAMMREVLQRRFSKQEEPLPDLLVVDGGKGQLSQAVAIFEEFGIQGVGVVGLAKARTESDFRSSKVESSFERVFLPGRKNPVSLLQHMGAYKVLTHLRDEAHRFAIGYHRLLRDKKSMGKR